VLLRSSRIAAVQLPAFLVACFRPSVWFVFCVVLTSTLRSLRLFMWDPLRISVDLCGLVVHPLLSPSSCSLCFFVAKHPCPFSASESGLCLAVQLPAFLVACIRPSVWFVFCVVRTSTLRAVFRLPSLTPLPCGATVKTRNRFLPSAGRCKMQTITPHPLQIA